MSPALRLAEVTDAARAELAAFACARYREPWSEVVEQAIRRELAGELEAGTSRAIGLWAEDDLVAVAAFRIVDSPMFPKACRVNLLAVRTDHQGRGRGRVLKEAVIDVARTEEAMAVASRVDRRNTRMLQLNLALGARVDPIEGAEDEVICTIPIRP